MQEVDKLITKASENRITPAEALTLERYLERETRPEGVLAPITLAKPTDIVPIAYVIHHWTTRCLACNEIAKHDEVFALNHLKSRFGTTLVRNLVPITSLAWNVPITEHVPVPRTVPFCSSCITEARDYVTTLPAPPPPAAAVTKFTAPKESLEGSPAPLPKTKPKSFTSVDDLLI